MADSKTIHVGWIDADGQENLAPNFFDTVELAQAYVDQLNAVEEKNHASRAGHTSGPDSWFAMVGEPICKIARGGCEGLPHHWMMDLDEEHPEGAMVCKHCQTWRTICDNDDEML